MQPNTPLYIDAAFILLTVFLVFVTLLAVRKVTADRKRTLRTFLVIFFWLVFLRLISGMNFFHDYQSIPPRLLIAPLTCFLAILLLAISKSFSGFLKKVPMQWLVYIQSFRIVMELILYQLAEEGIVHERLTFAGSNFDILVGITALAVGLMVQKNKISKTGLLVWNIAGIALLINIISLALLSTPYSFSIFKEEPVNTVIFYFPFVWLPGFVAPFALAMHVFSIRKILGEKRAG